MPKVKFKVESETSILIDPEAYDASEQEFAVSLEQPSPRARFVLEPEPSEGFRSTEQEVAPPPPALSEPSLVLEAEPPESEDRWRQEVAARLNHYRARRSPKQPRFPSLQLKFENETRHLPVESQPVLTQQAIPAENLQTPAKPNHSPKLRVTEAGENSARILEFPRLAVAPPRIIDELAEPILERPRILEVPDTAPAPPALGGILIGPVERVESKPSEFEVPLQSASITRRSIATALDAMVISTCVVVFANIFQALTPTVLTMTQSLAAGAALFGTFWACYHFLLLICCGTTLGLRLTGMQLRRFDGKPVSRSMRRWRALAAVMSAASLGLGYAWCLLDEDQLCWHDRITRTYVGPQTTPATKTAN